MAESGCSAATDAEFARHVDIALGSASETMHHLLTARDLDLLSRADYDGLSERLEAVCRMLTGLLKRLRPAGHATGLPSSAARLTR